MTTVEEKMLSLKQPTAVNTKLIRSIRKANPQNSNNSQSGQYQINIRSNQASKQEQVPNISKSNIHSLPLPNQANIDFN